MNHKYDIDWLAGWIICQRLGIMQGSKIIGKQSLRFVPIIGWCWIFTESIFLRRVWETDRQTLVKDMRKVLADYPKNSFFNVKKNNFPFRRSNFRRFSFYFFVKEHVLPRKNVK